METSVKAVLSELKHSGSRVWRERIDEIDELITDCIQKEYSWRIQKTIARIHNPRPADTNKNIAKLFSAEDLPIRSILRHPHN